jgi:hypothetical protein
VTSQSPTKATTRWPLPSKERRLELYHADGRRVFRLAAEIAAQVGAYERNISRSRGDEAEALRFLLVESLARELLRAARRAANRYQRARP